MAPFQKMGASEKGYIVCWEVKSKELKPCIGCRVVPLVHLFSTGSMHAPDGCTCGLPTSLPKLGCDAPNYSRSPNFVSKALMQFSHAKRSTPSFLLVWYITSQSYRPPNPEVTSNDTCNGPTCPKWYTLSGTLRNTDLVLQLE